MIDVLFFLISLLHNPNFLCKPTDKDHNWYALLSLFRVCQQSIGESSFPDVCSDIVAKPHSDGLSVDINLLLLDCSYHTGEHLHCIKIPSDLNRLPGFNSTKSNQRRPLPSREFLHPSSWISYNSAVHFNCCICTSHKNISIYETDIDAAATTTYPAFIWCNATLCDSAPL